jgi:hypothetical protein
MGRTHSPRRGTPQGTGMNRREDNLRRGIAAGIIIEVLALGVLGAVILLIGSYPLLLRKANCPNQPLYQPCTFQVRQ